MSSSAGDRSHTGAVLVLVASLLGLAWYGQGQLLYTLAFLFQVAQAVFPGLSAIRGAP